MDPASRRRESREAGHSPAPCDQETEMIVYQSRTGTKRNLKEMRRFGFRLFVSMLGVWRNEGFQYAIDNGAWSCYTQGVRWDADLFSRFYDLFGSDADFVVVPDIVSGGLESLKLSVSWLPKLSGLKLIPVQNGITAADVSDLLGHDVGIFVGGDDEWKDRTMRSWGHLARKRGCYLHVGRVNTLGRIRLAQEAGADSIDGSSATRFAKNAIKINKWTSQGGFSW
jgi:hypothetical protein